MVRRKKAAWKVVVSAGDEEAKERFMEAYREEKRKVKMGIYPSKKKLNEQFLRKMNEDENLFLLSSFLSFVSLLL